MIGCTILRAVSDILRTHRGRRGSGPGRLPVGVTVAGWSGPAGSDAASSTFALGLCCLPTGLCCFTLCPCGAPLSSGRRRALPTSRWPWAVCRAARQRAGSPARIATVVFAGVQWGGHDCGWIAVSAVLFEGLAPWRRPMLVRSLLGRHRGGGSPVARGCAGHGVAGLSTACQLVSITVDAHLVKWQSA